MSDTTNQPPISFANPFVAALQAVVGTFPPTAEQAERFEAEKAKLEFQSTKRRLENQDRRMAELKQATRRTLSGEISDE